MGEKANSSGLWTRPWIRLIVMIVLTEVFLSLAGLVSGAAVWSQILVLLVWASLVYGVYLACAIIADGLTRLIIRGPTSLAIAPREIGRAHV